MSKKTSAPSFKQLSPFTLHDKAVYRSIYKRTIGSPPHSKEGVRLYMASELSDGSFKLTCFVDHLLDGKSKGHWYHTNKYGIDEGVREISPDDYIGNRKDGTLAYWNNLALELKSGYCK